MSESDDINRDIVYHTSHSHQEKAIQNHNKKMPLELVSDLSLTLRQVKALVWRYVIIISRSYFRTIARMILTPLVLLLLFKYILHLLDEHQELYKAPYPSDEVGSPTKTMAMYVPTLALFTTLLHVHHYLDFMVSERSSGFRSLMMIMGLRRTSYYLANATCFITYVSIIAVISAIILINDIFQDSKASVVEIISLYLLFSFHLATFIFALASMISSSIMVSLVVYSMVILEPLYHRAITGLAARYSDSFRPVFLFSTVIVPYQSIRQFSESYILCANCDKSLVDQSTSSTRVSQPTYLILTAVMFWTLALLVVACWFDHICPWTADLPSKNPLSCLSTCTKSSQDRLLIDESSHEMRKYFENVNIRQPVGIQISRVTKKFKRIPAVDALSFNIHRGETTLLLGHNGAGKTTLMNMIYGKLIPDSGSVTINPPCVENVPMKTPFIGVCLQSNVFDEQLTVRQHLELFSEIKAVPLAPIERAPHIKTTIEDVSLMSHADKIPEELSGGMRRKLSLAMAFVGKSSVLILDEPSSGLDPDSRILVWDAIRRYRSDRTVLLSTQHMEEADYLGDRVAIMKAGKIVCCGSSNFLNKMLGSSYRLRVECSESKCNDVLTFIKRYFNEASVENDISGFPSSAEVNGEYNSNMVIKLISSRSQDTEQDLIRLLEELERDMTCHHIKSFALKSSSLEDVMLNTSDLESETITSGIAISLNQVASIDQILLKAPKSSLERPVEIQIHLLKALFYKNLHIYKRNYLSIFFYRLILATAGAYWLVSTISDEIYSVGSVNWLMIVHYIYYPAREKVFKFKAVQLSSEANFVIYWLAQFLIDSLSIVYLVVCVEVLLLNQLNNSIKFEPPSFQVQLILSSAVALLATSALLLAYVTSTTLRSVRSALSQYLILFMASVIVSFLTRLGPVFARNTEIKDILTKINQITDGLFIALLPTDSVSYLMYGLRSKCYLKTKSYLPDCIEVQGISPIILGFTALVGQIVTFSILLYLIDYKLLDISCICRVSNWLPCFSSAKRNDDSHTREDEDVIAEANKASEAISNPKSSLNLVAADLNKSYAPNTKVINNLSFTVGRGECFGLLGVNGAGKSTTFSIIAAECRPDSGRVCLRGRYLDDNVNSYRRNIGYDPQISPEELALSATEALYLMARLRQVDENVIPLLVSSVLEVLDMSQHADKAASKLSGGNLRKLSLGMSLIGNPNLLLLDEPTAGVDPLARRGIWRLLRSLRNQDGTSIVIASHAMEECEAICDRISIMARGRLRCVGSFLHLRNKFSQSCSLRVQFSSDAKSQTASPTHERTIKKLTQRLKAIFGDHIQLVDPNISSITYNISDRHLKRSELFKVLRDFKQSRPNISYMINDSSLEDIFIELAQEEHR